MANASNIDDILNKYAPSADETGVDDLLDKYMPARTAGEAGWAGASDMALMGYTPEIEAAGTRAALQVFDPRTFEAVKDLPEYSMSGIKADAQARMDEDLKQHPYAYRGGQVFGLLAQAPVMSAGLAKVGLGALPKAAPFAEKAVRGAGQGMLLGGAMNPNENQDRFDLNPAQRVSNAMGSGIVGLAIPAVIKGGGKVLDAGAVVTAPIGRGLKKAGKFGFDLTFGLNPEFTTEYMANHKRINAGPTVEELKNIADKHVGGLSDAVEQGKLSVLEATQKLRDSTNYLKDHFTELGMNAKDALTQAKAVMKTAQDKAIKDTAREVSEGVEKIMAQVKEGSTGSFTVLDEEGIQVSLTKLKTKLTQLTNELKIGGKVSVGNEARMAEAQLQTYRSLLDKLGKGKLPGTQAKELLMQLQNDANYAYKKAEYSFTSNSKLKQFNRYLREQLVDPKSGGSQKFRDTMKVVEKDAQLLEEVGDYVDPEKAAGLLGRIDSPTAIDKRQGLINLSKRVQELEPAQRELGKPMPGNYLEKINPDTLPERQGLLKAEAEAAKYNPVDKKRAFEQLTAQLPENQILQQRQEALRLAEEKLTPFSKIKPQASGASNVQAALEQFAAEPPKGKNIDSKRMFDELSKQTGIDFEQAMKDEMIRRGFKKMVINGARRVAAAGILGSLTGSAAGTGIGVVAGFSSDVWGPKAGKVILDSVIKFSENPTKLNVDKILAKIDLPPEAKARLTEAFRTYLLTNPPGMHKPLKDNTEEQK